MRESNYWLDLFTGTTWEEFLRAGATVSGHKERRRRTVSKVQEGDRLLCYITGISRFVGVLEVVSAPFEDDTPIWSQDIFPCRIRVRVLVKLTPETAVPISELRERLSVFKGLTKPNAWTARLRQSLAKWPTPDGETVLEALRQAEQHPVVRPLDPAKLQRKPAYLRAKLGKRTVRVTVPERDSVDDDAPAGREPTSHEAVQWLLLKIGNDMGLRVWVARNDRNREVDGHSYGELPHLLDELPVQFDQATRRTIELIDVLWLQKNAVVAAFEIESTTSIYSGLLRMSDLLSMQPNINIPLYLVAPEERREKVIAEVNRPTFSRLVPPLSQVCRFLPFQRLRERMARVGDMVRFLRPDFLDEVSEPCEIDQYQ